jgi:YecR-like lipoprotein
MKSVKIGAVSALLLVLAGCETPVNMVPMNGSRADGTIDMAFEYGLFQKPVVDQQQAASNANATCSGWGYSGARPFGGANQRCVYMTNDGCMRFQVTVRYQCTGAPSSR